MITFYKHLMASFLTFSLTNTVKESVPKFHTSFLTTKV